METHTICDPCLSKYFPEFIRGSSLGAPQLASDGDQPERKITILKRKPRSKSIPEI